MSKEKYTYLATENGGCIKDNEKKLLLDIAEVTKLLNYYEHRLSNCIEPKFVVGQKIWTLHKELNDVVETEIESIEIEIEEGVIDITYYDIDGIGFNADDLFLTEEEAKAKLEEMKNG